MRAREKKTENSESQSFNFAAPSANLAVAALTENAEDRSKIALVWESADGSRREVLSFFEIENLSNRVANVLTELGMGFGDRIFTLLNRTPELYATIPAILKIGAAAAVLFPDFGAEAVRQRLEDAGGRVLITNRANLEKVRSVCHLLPNLEHILVVGDFTSDEKVCAVQIHGFDRLARESSTEFSAVDVSDDDTCFLIYTSGTTGLPKGVVHRHAICERLVESAKAVLQLEPDDFFWCSADPGWVTGLFYGIFAPWLLGFPIFAFEGEFDSRRWLEILERNQITCLYTTPTLLRLLRNEIGDAAPEKAFALRRIYSVGEPLNPEILAWAERTFGARVFDNYWQTETGSFVIANRPNQTVKKGAMGKAVEGVQVSIIDNSGREVPDNVVGDIAVRPTLTSLFKGYWNFPEATRACFRAGWYITRDRGRRDADGYFWFMARSDDVITCQAQRVGPFEIENALVSHPAIAESAAVGMADAVTTEHVKAFVVLRKDFTISRRLAEEIAAHVRTQLSPLAMPREIEFCSGLPKTRSGKIRRDQLRRKMALDKKKVYKIE